jgi:hypothetical protein
VQRWIFRAGHCARSAASSPGFPSSTAKAGTPSLRLTSERSTSLHEASLPSPAIRRSTTTRRPSAHTPSVTSTGTRTRMNVPVKHGDVLVGRQHIHHVVAIDREPLPLRF